MNESQVEWIEFEVTIPSLDGTSIADRVPVQIPVTRDPDTGEVSLTPEAHERIEQTQARHLGLIAPSELRALRHRLCLSQRELGELIQIGEKSYTRWETGRARPSRSMNVLLCALRDRRLSVPYLKSLQKPVVEWWSSSYISPVPVTLFPRQKPQPATMPGHLKVA